MCSVLVSISNFMFTLLVVLFGHKPFFNKGLLKKTVFIRIQEFLICMSYFRLSIHMVTYVVALGSHSDFTLQRRHPPVYNIDMLSFEEYTAEVKALPFGKRVGKNVYVLWP